MEPSFWRGMDVFLDHSGNPLASITGTAQGYVSGWHNRQVGPEVTVFQRGCKDDVLQASSLKW